MNFNKPIVHELVNFIALAIAIISLPFSVPVCHAGLLLLAASWLAEGDWKRKWNDIKRKTFLWPFLLLFILHLAGLIYSQDVTNGWLIMEKKAFFFLLPLIMATITIRSIYLNLLLKSFIVSSFIAVVICFSVAFNHALHPVRIPQNFDYANSEEFKLLNPDISRTWSYFSYNELSSGINIHPTYLGLYILFSILLVIHFYKQQESFLSGWKKTGMLFLLLFFSLFILLLASRVITIVYIFICMAGLSWIFFNSGRASLAIAGGILIFTVSAVSIFINPISRYRSFQEFRHSSLSIETNKLYSTSSSMRLSLWWLGTQSINTSNWSIGNGTGDVKETMKDTAAKYGITNTINTYDPHNQFIYTLLSLGIVGVLTLMACLIMPLLQREFALSFLHLCFIGSILIACFTESVFELQKGIIFFSLFHSLFLFQYQPVQSPQLIVSHA